MVQGWVNQSGLGVIWRLITSILNSNTGINQDFEVVKWRLRLIVESETLGGGRGWGVALIRRRKVR